MSDNYQQRLSIWMQRKGYNQAKLAKLMQVNEATISLILNGHRPVGNAFVGAFIRAFPYADYCEVFGPTAAEPQPEAA